jgi:hypothetical protein
MCIWFNKMWQTITNYRQCPMFIIGKKFFFWDTLYIYVQRNYSGMSTLCKCFFLSRSILILVIRINCVGNARLSLLQVDHELSFDLYLLIKCHVAISNRDRWINRQIELNIWLTDRNWNEMYNILNNEVFVFPHL